ncbi:MAG: pentapeptide repeat-containing protein [Hydrotalea sp.]|nr:pentapeptide repeat-containing protein [Hydrotalea sp.]
MKKSVKGKSSFGKENITQVFVPRYRLLQILASLRRGDKLSPADAVYYRRLLPGMSSEEKRKRLARLEARWTKQKMSADLAMVADFLAADKKKFIASHEKKGAMLDLSFLDFRQHKVVFEQSIDLHLPISFLHSEFGEVYFQWARFQKKVNFRAAVFYEKVKFIDSTFENIANFEFTIFHKKAEFSGIDFHDRAAFNFATFENYVSFKGSSFHALLIDEAHFSILPNFRYTLFDKQVRFHSVYIPGPHESIAHDEKYDEKHDEKHGAQPKKIADSNSPVNTLAVIALADKRRRNKSYEDKYRTLKEMAASTNDHLHEHEFYGHELESKWLFKEFHGRWWWWVALPCGFMFWWLVDRNFWPMIILPLLLSTFSYLPLCIMGEGFLRQRLTRAGGGDGLVAGAPRRGWFKKIAHHFYAIAYLYLLRVYWLFSYYGQSLARPVIGFALLPFIFAFSYWRPGRGVDFASALHFSSLNMLPGNSLFRFNHLEYLKEKIFGVGDVALANFQSLVVTYPKEITLAYDVLLNLQEGLSLFFLFLIGLALRNKFRIV